MTGCGGKLLRQLVTLQLLGMHAEGKKHGKAAGRVRPIYVDNDVHAVAHAHGHVPVADDPLVERRPPVVGRRLVSGGKKLFGCAYVVLFHRQYFRLLWP